MVNRLLGFLFGKLREAHYNWRYKGFYKKYHISPDFGFNGTDIRIYGKGELIIDRNSYIGTNSTLELAEGCTIKIGHSCQISHNVRMYTSSSDPNQDFCLPKKKPEIKGDIIIGNGVWIGANVFINPGITIGDNVVIGANAVVTRDVAKNSIVGGVPARLIRFKNI